MNTNIGHIVGGKIIKSEGALFEIFNPSTGKRLATGSNASQKIIDKTIINSIQAFDEWNSFSLAKKASILFEYKELLEKNLESAGVLIENLGKEKKELKSEISELKEKVGKPVGSLFDGWVYSSKSGWIYTSPKIYPYAFSQNDGWLKYELGTDPRRVFYFKEDAWKVLNKQKNNKNDK